VHVIREDPTNRDLLYVGTSLGAYLSLDRGATWQRFMTGLPTVPVYDLKIHPRDRELIAATHGRGLWIVDVAPLQQMAGSTLAAVVAEPVHLFTPKTGYEYGQGPAMGESSIGGGHKVFAAPSPAYGAEIVYRVGAGAVPATVADGQGGARTESAPDSAPAGGRRRGGAARGPQASLVITNARGDTLRTLTGPAAAGLHRVVWDFRGRPAPRAPLSPSQRRDSVERAQRTAFVIDSLEKAGAARPVIETLRRLASGSIDAAALFRGGTRGTAAGGPWVARPGEGAIVGAGAAGEGGEGAAGAGEQGPMEALNAFPGGTDALTELFRIPGRPVERGGGGLAGLLGGAGGGRRGASAPVVPSGDYLVTLTVGGRSYRQLLRVERLSGGDDAGSAFGGDDDDDNDDP
jgi:hypothetical protein